MQFACVIKEKKERIIETWNHDGTFDINGIFLFQVIFYNNRAISRALIGREPWSIRVQTVAMT